MIEMPHHAAPQRAGAPRWLVAALLVIIGANILDAVGTASAAPQYQVINVPFPASLRIALVLAWIVVLAMLAIGLLRRRALAFHLAGPILTVYALFGFIWQILFARSDYARGQVGFQALLSLIALLPVWWIVIRRGWLRRTA